MRIVRTFARGRQVMEFESVDVFVRGITPAGHVVVIEIGAGGCLGPHPGAVAQLFLIVSGSGWVSGRDGKRVSIGAGEAAIWEPGEEHESGSEEGMTALVVEADRLNV